MDTESQTSPVLSVADVATAHASRYLQQLCKHFAHKIPAAFDERSGQVSFPIGECRLAASGESLRLSLAAADDGRLEQLKDVVARHLVRFAFRENLVIAWRPEPGGEEPEISRFDPP